MMIHKESLLLGIAGTIFVLLLVAGGIYYYTNQKADANHPRPGTVACTLEAKECPDGSYVGRSGPNCEFAACPGTAGATSTASSTSSTNIAPPQATGVIKGTVSLSPTCPVERIPPDPSCAPKPYQTSIVISKNIEAPQPFMTAQSNASGTFTAALPAGEYLFYVQGGAPYPRCGEQLADIVAGQTNYIAITCDTGIR